MKDEDKTKEQLIDELEKVRQRISELETQLEIQNASSEEKIKKFKAVSDNINYGISISNLMGKIIYVNKYFASKHGYKPEEIIGMNLNIFYTDEQFKQIMELNQKLLGNGSYSDLEIWHKHKDGTVFPMLMSGVVIKDENDKPSFIVTTANDITRHKLMEGELQRNYDNQTVINSLLQLSLENNNLDEILKQSVDIILSIPLPDFNSKGVLFLVDDEPETLIMKANKGVTEEIRQSCFKVPFGKCLCGQIALKQKIQFVNSIDYYYESCNGKIAPHSYYCIPILLAGKTLGVLNLYFKEGARRNLKVEEFLNAIANTMAIIIYAKKSADEKEKMRVQLMQSQKMEAIGMLSGGVAHDFNNLMTAILGYTELAMMDVNESDPLFSDLKKIGYAADRAVRLTRQLLLFSRKQTMNLEFLNINTMISNLVRMLTRIIGEDITIITRLQPDLWLIQSDESSIEQIVMNLAVNARDAMPEGGTFTIRTENIILDDDKCKVIPESYPGKFVCLSIEDTGIGMDKDTIQRIFEPFFTTKEVGKGTGLGLSVVYGIVQQHRGWINVYSEHGNGSIFKVYFPAIFEKQKNKPKKTGSIQDFQGGGERVLLVEDEETVRNFASTALRENGYIVFDAADAKDAMNIFEKEKGKFHIVFSDVVLPGKNGIQLVDQLSSHKPELRVLLSSGYTDYKSQQQVINQREIPFLPKPYTIVDLLIATKEAMGGDSSYA